MASERPTAAEAGTLHDEGLLNVTDFLYVLRNDAASAAERLWEEIVRLQNVLDKANKTYTRLSHLAHSAERAAEREHDERMTEED